MAKRINKGLVGVIAGVIFGVMTVGGVVFVNSLHSTDPTEYIKFAGEAVNEGNYKRARAYYQHAYGQTNNPEHLIQVGSMYLAEGKQREAMQTWRQAVVQDPTLIDARTRIIDLLIEICMATNKNADWRQLAQSGEELLRHQPENAKAAHAIGLAKSRTAATRAEVLEAQQYLEKAVTYDSVNVGYTIDLAEYYAGQGQWDRAKVTYENLVASKQSPGADAVEARIAYANALQRTGKVDEPLTYLQQAVSLAGNDPKSLANAQCAIGQYWVHRWAESRVNMETTGDRTYFDKAKQSFEQAIAAQPEGFEAYKRLAELLMSVGAHEAILDLCQKRFDLPRETEGLEGWIHSNEIYRLECWASMAALGAAMELPQDSEKRTALLDKSEALALQAISRAPTAEFAYITAAQIKAERGNIPAAIADLEAASHTVEGLSWQGLKNLGILYKAERQLGKALEVASKAVEDPDADLPTHRLYMEMLLTNNRVTDMIEHGQNMLAKYPGYKPFLELVMEGYRLTGQTDRLAAVRRQLEALGEDYSMAEARTLADQGLINEAVKKANLILEKEPANLEALSFAARLLLEHDKADEAIELLKKGLEAAPDDLNIKQMLMTAEAGDSQEELFEKSLALRQQEIKDPLSRAGEIGQLYLRFGKAKEAREQFAEALRIYDAQESDTAKNLPFKGVRGLMETIFMLALDDQDWPVAEDMVRRAIKLDLDGCSGLLFQGQLHNAKGEFSRAQDTLNRALAKQPGNAMTLTALGKAYLGLGHSDAAKDAFERAIEVNPYEGEAHKGLAQIARKANDIPGFVKHLKLATQYLSRDPWVVEQRLMVEETADPKAAIARREQLRKTNPNDTESLWQLVQLYAVTGELPKADKLVEEYMKAAGPNDESVVLRVASYFSSTNRGDRGLQILQQAVARAQDNSTRARMLLMLSTVQQALGKTKEGEKSILEAAAVEQSASVIAAATQFYLKQGDLEQALTWVKKEPPSDHQDQFGLQSLSRLSMEILLQMGKFDELSTKADEHLQKYPDDGIATLLKAQALIGEGKLEDALSLLSSYVQDHPDDTRAVWDLASLQATMSQWATVVDALEQLRGRKPAALNYLPRVLLIEAYIRSEQRDKAKLEIDAILKETTDLSPFLGKLIPMLQQYNMHAECMKVLTLVVNRDAKNPLYLGWRGDTALKMDDPGRAYVDYNSAFMASNGNPYYALKLLDYFGIAKERSAGQSFFEKLPPGLKKDPRFRYRLAALLGTDDDIAPAAREYESILVEVGSEHPDICFETLEAAVKAFPPQQLIQSADETTAAGAAIKLAAMISGSAFTDAAATWKQVSTQFSQDPLLPILATYGGQALAAGNQLPDATAVYEKAINGSPTNVRAMKELAGMLLANGRSTSDATRYLERAVDISATDAELSALLAGAYFASMEPDKGCVFAHRALTLKSDCVPAMYYLGNYFRTLENHMDETRGLLLDAYRLTTAGRYPQWRARVVSSFTSLEKPPQ